MHRASPSNTSFRAFSGGGTRSAVDIIDDLKLMQEHAGNFMANESRKEIEAPQNYGFTSVVMPAIKDALGKITDSAEAMISFMGGNRSFPVAGVMDDRRHRLFGLQPGDVGMFRTALDQLQMHFTGDGGFFSGAQDKAVRMQLVAKQKQQGSSGAQTRDASGGASGAGGQQSGKQQKGQKPVYKNGQDSDFFLHIDKTGTTASGVNVYLRQGGSFGSSQSGGGSAGTRNPMPRPPRPSPHPSVACGRPRRNSYVVSSGATMPARAPASMLMLQIVIRPSIDNDSMALPRYSMT